MLDSPNLPSVILQVNFCSWFVNYVSNFENVVPIELKKFSMHNPSSYSRTFCELQLKSNWQSLLPQAIRSFIFIEAPFKHDKHIFDKHSLT
jgi:hypothetical protein